MCDTVAVVSPTPAHLTYTNHYELPSQGRDSQESVTDVQKPRFFKNPFGYDHPYLRAPQPMNPPPTSSAMRSIVFLNEEGLGSPYQETAGIRYGFTERVTRHEKTRHNLRDDSLVRPPDQDKSNIESLSSPIRSIPDHNLGLLMHEESMRETSSERHATALNKLPSLDTKNGIKIPKKRKRRPKQTDVLPSKRTILPIQRSGPATENDISASEFWRLSSQRQSRSSLGVAEVCPSGTGLSRQRLVRDS